MKSSTRRPARLAAGLLLVAVVSAFSVPAQDANARRGFSIKITSPTAGEFVLGKTKIAATVNAESSADVDRVEFLVGDQVIFVDREPPYETTYDFGEHSKSFVIRAIAYHKEGISVSDAVVTRRLDLSYVEEVNRVILWATVMDKQDRFIPDVKKENLRVYEDDAPQNVIDFYPEDRPITLAILLDTSGSMRDQIKEVHEAAGSFVDTLRPQDKALIIDFSDNVFLIQDLTSDHQALKDAITSTSALGGTAIYDALHAAYRKLKTIDGRKAIVLLSDGEDTTSQFGYDRVLEEAKANNLLIYGIGLGGGFGEGPRRNVLKEFSETTGGRAYFPGKVAELAGVYEQIAEELSRQYYLTYSTSNKTWDGRWVKIRVETDIPGAKVRARKGYFAVKTDRGEPGGTPPPPKAAAR